MGQRTTQTTPKANKNWRSPWGSTLYHIISSQKHIDQHIYYSLLAAPRESLVGNTCNDVTSLSQSECIICAWCQHKKATNCKKS